MPAPIFINSNNDAKKTNNISISAVENSEDNSSEVKFSEVLSDLNKNNKEKLDLADDLMQYDKPVSISELDCEIDDNESGNDLPVENLISDSHDDNAVITDDDKISSIIVGFDYMEKPNSIEQPKEEAEAGIVSLVMNVESEVNKNKVGEKENLNNAALVERNVNNLDKNISSEQKDVADFPNEVVDSELDIANENKNYYEVDFETEFESAKNLGADVSFEDNKNIKSSITSSLSGPAINSNNTDSSKLSLNDSNAISFNDNNWQSDFSNKLVFMSKNNIDKAAMEINPPELGKIEILLKMNSEQASLTLGSNQEQVRNILQDNVMQLREILQAEGIDLGNVNVGEESGFFQKYSENNNGAKENSNAKYNKNEEGNELVESDIVNIKKLDTLVDYYA